MMTEPEAQLRRGLLRAARPGAVLQDQIDCAELALSAGLMDTARMLYGLVLLHLGFGPEGLALQRELEARTGLWGAPERPMEAGRDGALSRFSVDIALAELKGLLQFKPGLGRPADPSTISPAPEASATQPELGALRECVRELLMEVPRLEAQGRLAPALCAVADALATLSPISVEEHLDEDAAGLATLFAVRGIRGAAFVARDFLQAEPTGALFAEAGRLNPAGLGPYFSNVRLVVRGGHDIPALVEATCEGRLTEEELEAWCVLLSHGLDAPEAADLAEELGDRGLVRALRAQLARTARADPLARWAGALARIRDAGLDLGDLPLAEAAQRLIVPAPKSKGVESIRLGEIRATLGDGDGARSAFERALRLDPADEDARERLDALAAGDFSPFEVVKGYDSSQLRHRLRRRLSAQAA